VRRVLLAFAALAITAPVIAIAACVTPKDDYEDFLNRTADARAALLSPPVVDAGSMQEASPTEASSQGDGASQTDAPASGIPDGGFTGTYYMACMTPLSNGDVTKKLELVVTLQVTPVDGGGGDQVALTTLALTTVPNPATNISEVSPRAVPYTATGTLNQKGVGAVIYSVATVTPGDADPIVPGSDIHINAGAEYQLTITSPTQICGGFQGQSTTPIPQTLVPAQNPCVFRIPDEDGGLPTLSASDFVWPCP
jgi:hypothetical protein